MKPSFGSSVLLLIASAMACPFEQPPHYHVHQRLGNPPHYHRLSYESDNYPVSPYTSESSVGYPLGFSMRYPMRVSVGYKIKPSLEYPLKPSLGYSSESSLEYPAVSSPGYPSVYSPEYPPESSLEYPLRIPDSLRPRFKTASQPNRSIE